MDALASGKADGLATRAGRRRASSSTSSAACRTRPRPCASITGLPAGILRRDQAARSEAARPWRHRRAGRRRRRIRDRVRAEAARALPHDLHLHPARRSLAAGRVARSDRADHAAGARCRGYWCWTTIPACTAMRPNAASACVAMATCCHTPPDPVGRRRACCRIATRRVHGRWRREEPVPVPARCRRQGRCGDRAPQVQRPADGARRDRRRRSRNHPQWATACSRLLEVPVISLSV